MPLPLQQFSDPDDVERQLQVLGVDGYGVEAQRAVIMLARKLEDLSLRDEGRLGLVNSRNHARRVRDVCGSVLVLKVTTVVVGNEVGALLAWQRAGLAGDLTPAVRAWGETDEGYQWILQDLLPGRTGGVADGVGMENEVIDVARRLAIAGDALPDVLELADRRLGQWRCSAGSRAARAAAGVQRLLNQASWADSCLLHGDLGANNLLVHREMVRVIDPAGLSGPAVFDIARFIARSTSRIAVAPRIAGLAAVCGVAVDHLAVPAAYELLDVAEWSLRHDITGRGTSALLDDVEALVRLVT